MNIPEDKMNIHDEKMSIPDESSSVELVERKRELEMKIRTLEWDKNLRQINFSKNRILERCKEELSQIESSLKEEEVV